MIPRATYRFQFHKGFPFAAAEALVPYLDALGISHVYASPITVSTARSMHGYDVIDPTRIDPELGGEPAFRSLVAALKTRGMGVVIDIVPNHMGVGGGENAWWNDVLRRGQASDWARFFDIDWRERIVLPVLGSPLGESLANGDLALEQVDGRWVVTAYGEQHFPIRDEEQDGLAADADLPALLARQHYRLAWWRIADDELNWRRFFTVNELAGLRIEDDHVFETTHALYFRLYDEGLIDGVRVDHVDGLTDPAGYCRKLRERLGHDAYIVVEKILGEGEPLAPDWGIDGTSGYDFMEQVSALLHEPEGEAPLGALWHRISRRPAEFEPEELQARQDMLAWAFEGQLAGCVAAFAALAASAPEAQGLTPAMLRRAIERLLWVFPVYRTYGTGSDAPAADERTRTLARAAIEPHLPPGEHDVPNRILDWLAGTGPGEPALAAEAVRRFQQLSSPIAAKSVEDTAFYRYGRLLSRNNVGFAPTLFASHLEDFHAVQAARAQGFPHEMLATATHDHKRGEDVRSRLVVVSGLAAEWEERAARWQAFADPFAIGVQPADVYMLFQTIFGAWPEGLRTDDAAGLAAYAERLVAWQEKALREAKLRSSWEAPNEGYEARAKGLVEALLDPARSPGFLADLADWLARTRAPMRANMLVQAALRYTCPGVPDCYQGTELEDFSLVDPDNRRPVDYAARERRLADGGHEKLALIHQLLDLRRSEPALFGEGDYRPLPVAGERAANVIAFERQAGGKTLRVVALLRAAAALAGGERPVPAAAWWSDTRLADGTLIGALLAEAPVVVTIR